MAISDHFNIANGIGGPVCVFVVRSVSRVQEESATRISGAAFSLFLCFVFIFVSTENPNSHMYVVVKGISIEILALLRTGYSDEMLIQNDDKVTDPYILYVCMYV